MFDARKEEDSRGQETGRENDRGGGRDEKHAGIRGYRALRCVWRAITALPQAVPCVHERAHLHEEERPAVTGRPPADAVSRSQRRGGHACYRAAAARVGSGKIFTARRWPNGGPTPTHL